MFLRPLRTIGGALGSGARVNSLALALALVLAAAGCTRVSPPDPTETERYLADRAFRRAQLEDSLVNPANEYSRRRLAQYATDDSGSWDLLPEWNPRAEPVADAELDQPSGALANAPLGGDARPLEITSEALAGRPDALRILGEQAFFRYPAQLAHQAEHATQSRQRTALYGFWTDARHGVGGLVRAEMADRSREFAFTCSTCHASRSADGSLVIGVGNPRLDLGTLAVDTAAVEDPERTARLLAWGGGRVDVSTSLGTDPVRIPDLRPTRWLTHLHHDATIRQTGIVALAIRLETLIITSNNNVVRPPRVIAIALATYLWSLSASVASRALSTEPERRGASLFEMNCSGCHAAPGFTGSPVAIETVGTDPLSGRSPDRGTGMYRVPSLHGVASRPLLLHDASLARLDRMFDPARTRSDFTGGTRPGAVPGHEYGLALDAGEREDLLAYLRTL